MPIQYKMNVLKALEDAGYSTSKLREENLMSRSAMEGFLMGRPGSCANLGIVCELLHCQPGDLLEYVPEQKAAE